MRIVRPSDRVPSPKRGTGRVRPRTAPAEFAIEKSLARYIKLECKHLTTRQEQEIYQAFRPARDKYRCEQCHKWVKLMPKPKVEPIPQEPLF